MHVRESQVEKQEETSRKLLQLLSLKVDEGIKEDSKDYIIPYGFLDLVPIKRVLQLQEEKLKTPASSEVGILSLDTFFSSFLPGCLIASRLCDCACYLSNYLIYKDKVMQQNNREAFELQVNKLLSQYPARTIEFLKFDFGCEKQEVLEIFQNEEAHVFFSYLK
jgi:hypothetical protein